MVGIRYDKLSRAAKKNSELYRAYEVECRSFISDLQRGLSIFLSCPLEQVIWLQYDEESKKSLESKRVVDTSVDRRMHLLDDAFYLFSFALKLAAGQTFILHFRVKQVDDCFVVKASGKEWRFQQDKQETLEELFVCIFEELKEYLETDFEKFIQGKRNTIGFQIP